MNKQDLLNILAYLNIGLAVAHNAGVKLGHFGSTDFLSLAQDVNNVLLGSLQAPSAAGPVAVQTAA